MHRGSGRLHDLLRRVHSETASSYDIVLVGGVVMRVHRTLGLFAALAALTFSTAQAQTALPPVDPSNCQIAPIAMPVQGEEGDLSTPAPTPTPISQESVVP